MVLTYVVGLVLIGWVWPKVNVLDLGSSLGPIKLGLGLGFEAKFNGSKFYGLGF